MFLTFAGQARAASIFDQTLTTKSFSTGKTLAAHVTFEVIDNSLKIIATNTGAPAESPSDVLTGILWDLNTPQTLKIAGIDFTTKTGGERDRLLHASDSDVLGKHWQYLQFSKPVGNELYGVGACGLGGTFSSANFVAGGMQLQGVDYGIVNGLGKKANTGTNVPLVSDSLTFTFTLPGTNLTSTSTAPLEVTGLRLQYGSKLSEPFIAYGNATPEPGTLTVISLSGIALLRRRKTR